MHFESSDIVNPLLPSAPDVVWAVFALVSVVLAVVALVQIWRRRNSLGVESVLIFGGIAIVLPVVGPLFWFLVQSIAARKARH